MQIGQQALFKSTRALTGLNGQYTANDQFHRIELILADQPQLFSKGLEDDVSRDRPIQSRNQSHRHSFADTRWVRHVTEHHDQAHQGSDHSVGGRETS